MINAINVPTISVLIVKNRLIRSLIDKHASSSAFFHDTNRICEHNHYVKISCPPSSKVLFTFDTADLYIMLLQEEVINVPCEFFIEHCYRKVARLVNASRIHR